MIRPKMPALLAHCFLYLIVVFLINHAYLNRGLFQDDFGFFHMQPFTPNALFHFFHPDYGWFYRPIFLLYIDLSLTIFHRSVVTLHALSLFLYALTLFLLDTFGRRLTGASVPGLAAALLFLLTPHKEEAIWWISSASTLLASVFYFGALHAWYSWHLSHRKRWYISALCLLALALCSKEDAVSLPLALLLLNYYLAPHMTLQRRLNTFLPIIIITALYGACDIAAYQIISAHDSTARLFAFAPMTRLHILSTFGLTTLVTNYWGLMMPYQSPIIVFAAVVVVLLWASWRFPLLRTLTLIALIAVVPIPIASGHHVMSERFTYLPAMFASLLYTALLWFFIKDAKPQVQLAAGALIINAALWRWPQAWSPDIGSTIMILLLTLLVGYVFYRIQWIAAPVLGWLVSVAVLSQVSIFLSDPGPMVCGLLALTIGGALAQKSGTWPGIVISAALWYAPHFSLPLFLFAAAGQGQGLLIKNRLSFLPFLSDRPVNTIHLTQEIDSLEQK